LIAIAIAVGHGFDVETKILLVRLAVVLAFATSFFPWRSLKLAFVLISAILLLGGDMEFELPSRSLALQSFDFGFTIRFLNLFDQMSSELTAWWNAKISYASYTERTWSEAILRGTIYRLNPEFVAWFRQTGLFHVLVVSGFHFSVILGSIRQLLLLPLRILYSINYVDCRTVQRLIFAVSIVSGLAALILLQFLLSTPPAQRAFCCFVVNLLLIGMRVRFDRFTRLQISLFMHAWVFPEGLVSSSGILSWLIYLSVFACGVGLKRLFWLQLDIACIVGVLFGQLNLIGILLNLWSGILGTLMLATAVVPVWFGMGEFAGVRYWNLVVVNHILNFVRWAAELDGILHIQLHYQLKSYIRWLLAVFWCVRLLSRFSKRACGKI
jgi:hypothetical protein